MTALRMALDDLTAIQRQSADWSDGPLLVLAGPGSGKTQVLTCRIAGLLDASRGRHFRVLALTFTNKAADEMKARVARFVPGLEERANIGTFHGFCGQMLRQHGVHIGVKPDFAIYSADADRRAILEDALLRAQECGESVSPEDVKYLKVVDRLKERLVAPADAPKVLAELEESDVASVVYRLYEAELSRLNALDFNSLISAAFQLLAKYPSIAVSYRRAYPFWLIDEFQDTNSAQYKLIRLLAGSDFKNVFVVADDDQIIYEWNGASYRQIQSFLTDFKAQVIQLPTNYRCPVAIVAAANRLVAYNAQRTAAKAPLIAGKSAFVFPADEQVQLRVFENESAEAVGIAREIAQEGRTLWGRTTVLARTRSLLEQINSALREERVPSVIAQRRDDFLSPEFRWLFASLRQLVRPLDRRNATILIEAFNRFSKATTLAAQVLADAEATGRGYLATWLQAARSQAYLDAADAGLLKLLSACADNPITLKASLEGIVDEFRSRLPADRVHSDLEEDLAAWKELCHGIAAHVGRDAPLDQFLQELQLRSKDPTPSGDTVTLMTIHGAKGREFDCVYVIGLAEDVMPSYQSRMKGDLSAEMEEERRSCFVAITRTKERLVLSRAETYRGWRKAPSRFLVQMGFTPLAADSGGLSLTASQ
ncbi:MAG: ATP-dependent helicase UvrD/PcrA [Thermoanaerobaculia bacterium]|jgi:DNA helicase-2/ATP-dependent DNA helicase PcrA|nr:ATP-dependent helicase UvrD/PcrA [Thermoanaerobaculia bacterium]